MKNCWTVTPEEKGLKWVWGRYTFIVPVALLMEGWSWEQETAVPDTSDLGQRPSALCCSRGGVVALLCLWQLGRTWPVAYSGCQNNTKEVTFGLCPRRYQVVICKNQPAFVGAPSSCLSVATNWGSPLVVFQLAVLVAGDCWHPLWAGLTCLTETLQN